MVKKSGYYRPDFVSKDWTEIKIANIDKYDHLLGEESLNGYTMPDEIREQSINFWIKGVFEINVVPEDIYLVYEDLGYTYEIYINGIIVNNVRESYYVWDKSNKRINIHDYLKKGENIVVIMTRTPEWSSMFPLDHYIEPIVLMGKFTVLKNRIDKEIDKIKLGSWTEEGFTYYFGTGRYSNSFIINSTEIEKIKNGKKLFIEISKLNEIAEIFINGKKVKRILWPPFMADISSFIDEGKNLVSIDITNTLGNLFNNRMDSGILGKVNLYLV